MLIGIILLVSICIGLLVYIYKLKQQRIQIIEINKEKEFLNLELKRNIEAKEKELRNINSCIIGQNNILKSLNSSINELQQNAEKRAEEAYNSRSALLHDKYLKDKEQLEKQLTIELENLTTLVNQEQHKLSVLEQKQLAYIEARKRQQEIEQRQDFYRLVIDQLDLNDISLLREIQSRFSKKESIDKLIWEVYYKPAYDILMANLFKSAGKVCGIYQIVDLTTGQGYIGQSVDIKERFRTHIKSGLTYGKQTNKLYQAMQKAGAHNFTFEILEEVDRAQLNEREAYWISFYKTKEHGMNSTKGNS